MEPTVERALTSAEHTHEASRTPRWQGRDPHGKEPWGPLQRTKAKRPCLGRINTQWPRPACLDPRNSVTLSPETSPNTGQVFELSVCHYPQNRTRPSEKKAAFTPRPCAASTPNPRTCATRYCSLHHLVWVGMKPENSSVSSGDVREATKWRRVRPTKREARHQKSPVGRATGSSVGASGLGTRAQWTTKRPCAGERMPAPDCGPTWDGTDDGPRPHGRLTLLYNNSIHLA